MIICTAGWLRRGRDCQKPASHLLSVACVHEHGIHSDGKPTALCEWHYQDIADGKLFCGTCYDSEYRHLCELKIISEQPTLQYEEATEGRS